MKRHWEKLRVSRVGIVVLLPFLFFTSCTQKNNNINEIRIGFYDALSGAESVYGVETLKGATLAVEQAGKINGKSLRLISIDDEGKADVAVTAVTKLITQDKVDILIGESTSTRTLAAAAIAQASKIPLIATSATNPKVTEIGNYIFRVCFTDPFQGKVMANHTIKNLKKFKAAILKDMKADYSLGLSSYYKKTFEEEGGKIVSELTYSSGDVDFRSQLTAIKNSQADVLFIPGYYTEVGLIARQAKELHFTGILLGGDGWDSEKLMDIGGDAIIGGQFANHYFNGDKAEGVQAFIQSYKARYKEVPSSSSVLGYDAIRLAIDAMKRSKTNTSEELRKTLSETKSFQSVMGLVKIDENRNPIKTAVVVQVEKGGLFSFVASVNP